MSGPRLRIGLALLVLGAVVGLQAHAYGPGPCTLSEFSTAGVPVKPHAAIVTGVQNLHDNRIDGCLGMASVTVFPEGGHAVPRTGVYVFGDVRAAEAYLANPQGAHVSPPLVGILQPADVASGEGWGLGEATVAHATWDRDSISGSVIPIS